MKSTHHMEIIDMYTTSSSSYLLPGKDVRASMQHHMVALLLRSNQSVSLELEVVTAYNRWQLLSQLQRHAAGCRHT